MHRRNNLGDWKFFFKEKQFKNTSSRYPKYVDKIVDKEVVKGQYQ